MSAPLATEEAENTKLKLVQLETKVNDLERSVNELSSEVRKVLTDVRAVVSEMENPLNFLKGLGIDEVVMTMAKNITESKIADFVEKKVNVFIKNVLEGKIKALLMEKMNEVVEPEISKLLEDKLKRIAEGGGLGVEVKEEQLKSIVENELKELLKDYGRVNVNSEEFKKSLEGILREVLPSMVNSDAARPEVGKAELETRTRRGGLMEQLNSTIITTLCAICLLFLFGRKGVEAVLDEYARNNWLPSELKMSILRSIRALNIPGVADERGVGIEDHIVALYMLNKLKEGAATSLEFTVFLLLLSRSHTTRTG